MMAESRAARGVTRAVVLFVAVIAAVVSFVHIEHLAITYGQNPAGRDAAVGRI